MLDPMIEPRNGLLRRLPRQDLQQLSSMLEPVPLRARRLLDPAGSPMTHVYFIERGLVSVIAHISPTKGIETWLIGPEGLTGVPLILGNTTTVHRRIVQVSGFALRMPFDCLRAAMFEIPAFHDLLLRYVNSVLVATSQLAACNAGHSVRERLARWLLLAHDRCEGNELPLTHDMLSRMVGVRRASVTDGLNELERSGLISTGRGLIRIEDARRLRARACRCYHIISREYDRLLRHDATTPRPSVVSRENSLSGFMTSGTRGDDGLKDGPLAYTERTIGTACD